MAENSTNDTTAPGWQATCLKCRTTQPINRRGGYSRGKVTLGRCKSCGWVWFFKIWKQSE